MIKMQHAKLQELHGRDQGGNGFVFRVDIFAKRNCFFADGEFLVNIEIGKAQLCEVGGGEGLNVSGW